MGAHSDTTLRQWLKEGPFFLGLSSGFFGFFAHTGMVSVLEDEGLWPSRVSGSSAGALVGGLWAAGMSAEQIRDELVGLRREDFWDPWPGFGLLRGKLFRQRLERILPVATFDECRYGLCVSTHDVLSNRVRVLAEGPLARAIHASCAVPLLFQPVWLGLRPHLDGGVVDRHGIAGLPPGGRLFYHHLSSKSPWRRADSPALRPPERPDTVSLIVDGLPRLGPFKLQNARRAYEQARAATRRALDRPIRDDRVQLPAAD